MIEVRGAEQGEPSRHSLSPFNPDDFQTALKSNLRFQEQAADAEQPEIRNMLQGMENELDAIFDAPMPGDLAPESPKFDDKPYELLNAFSKLDEKELTKQVFGEKTFDFQLEAPDGDIQIGNIAIPKDERRRKNFEKQLLTLDHNLGGKVQRLKDQLKQSSNKTVRFEDAQMIQHRLQNLNISNSANTVKDPLADVFQLDKNAQSVERNEVNFGELVNQNAYLQKFLGISPNYEILDETALFGSPENMEIDNQFDVFMENGGDPATPFAYGEDVNNDEVFKDAFASPITQDPVADDTKMDIEVQPEETAENENDFKHNTIITERQQQLIHKLESMKDNTSSLVNASDDDGNVDMVLVSSSGQKIPVLDQPSKLTMAETFMDLMMLQKQRKVNLTQDSVQTSTTSGTRKANFA